ncbi:MULTISPECIES: hypothetical protein [unclassified Gordonia (in: high G+C Gram-positive bacteria)]|uniref:hypothetical protein n=1 Tax=unclassified Gordonia (in: high G+C Gram-positive bacteria) TaxID=2657482 RepID=UPI00071C42CD|nr:MULTISPECIES: hypothetical protein [unclassified Gordonia (in: high G+C Gram-positive bacteria)]KSU54477.1 hypothetical protein AS181_21010 [Gordonia sp. SGD-V-85]SCC53647.1 hypothetical protein GA0061091_12410 [Gordonia sp. v-85]
MSVDPDHDQLGLFAVPATHLAGGTATPSPGVVTDPTLMPDARAEEHFWQHVVLTPRGCWYWIGAISSPDGYGRFTFRRNNRQRAISAHRFALLLVHPDLGADAADIGEHYCNEPLCVRVDSAHVRIGTQTNNLTYAVGLGRHRGSRPTTAIDRAARSIMLRTYLRDGGDPDHAHRLFQPVPSAAADQLGLF